mmetsp:Transcript_8118/g.11706  ORF Transcript_8118/g.11706 Transcript_8118/m.11706 type:complete len:239 (-) Transcript_8118:233-949(-)
MAGILSLTSRRCLPAARQILPRFAPAAVASRAIHSSAARQHQAVNPGWPVMYSITYDKPGWDPEMELEYDVMPRDEFGVPAHIPPELSTTIRHTYYVPPQYYPFLKKLGDDTPELKPYMDKLMNGELTFDDYEEMFYLFAKPLKIHRPRIAMPYRTAEEMKKSEEVYWEGAWLSFRQRVLGDYFSRHYLRDMVASLAAGIYLAYIFIEGHRQYRVDMKLFYLEAPEHKINWVVPRGDL